MSVKTLRFGFAALLVCALAGCSGGGPQADAASTESPSTAPSATATAESSSAAPAVTQLTDAELAGVFTKLQFVPGEYADSAELLDSIYPGLTTSDASCLAPFGVGWESTLPEAALEFGASNDRSMTAVVASVGDADLASGLVADAADALTRCAQGAELFLMQGQAVQTQVEPFEVDLTGADESVAFRVTGEVAGTPFALVGATARVGGNVVALVGWDPSTNESYVPIASQMFVDNL